VPSGTAQEVAGTVTETPGPLTVQEVSIPSASQLSTTVSPAVTRVGAAVMLAVPSPGQLAVDTTGHAAGVATFEAATCMPYEPGLVKVRVVLTAVPYPVVPSEAVHVYGPVAPFSGCAVYVTVSPGNTLVLLTVQDTDGGGGATEIALQAPQLLDSLDSVTKSVASAHARMYHVPADGKV